MYFYKLTVCNHHSGDLGRIAHRDLDSVYTISFNNIKELVDNLLRNEAQLVKNDMCALITRHYKDENKVLVILEKGYEAGYSKFFLTDRGFKELKRRNYKNRPISSCYNPLLRKYAEEGKARIRITVVDCTVWYVDVREAADSYVDRVEKDLQQIEAVHGTPEFETGVIIRSRREEESWKSYIQRSFNPMSDEAPIYEEELNPLDAFYEK